MKLQFMPIDSTGRLITNVTAVDVYNVSVDPKVRLNVNSSDFVLSNGLIIVEIDDGQKCLAEVWINGTMRVPDFAIVGVSHVHSTSDITDFPEVTTIEYTAGCYEAAGLAKGDLVYVQKDAPNVGIAVKATTANCKDKMIGIVTETPVFPVGYSGTKPVKLAVASCYRGDSEDFLPGNIYYTTDTAGTLSTTPSDKLVGYAIDSYTLYLFNPFSSTEQTYIVATVSARDDLTPKKADRCFVTGTGDTYIYDGSSWQLVADADWANVNLSWSNITDKPSAFTPESHGNEKHSSTFITSSGVTYENLNTNGDVGTGSSQVAQGDHNHDTAYVKQADYEDSDVIAKVKNVDGAGSGLDADLLDGSHGSAFAKKSADSDIDMNNYKITELKQATANGEVDNENSGTAKTIDWGAGTFQKLTLTGNCTLSFTAPAGPTYLQLKLIQDATGSRTITLPSACHGFDGGAALTLSTAANAVDFLTMYYDGTNYHCALGLNSKAFT